MGRFWAVDLGRATGRARERLDRVRRRRGAVPPAPRTGAGAAAVGAGYLGLALRPDLAVPRIVRGAPR